MPFPAILGIIGVGTAIYGAKKIYDAVTNDDDDDDSYSSDDDGNAEAINELNIKLRQEKTRLEASKQRFYSAMADSIDGLRSAAIDASPDCLSAVNDAVSAEERAKSCAIRFKNEEKDFKKVKECLNNELDDIINSAQVDSSELDDLEADIKTLKEEIAKVKNFSL